MGCAVRWPLCGIMICLRSNVATACIGGPFTLPERALHPGSAGGIRRSEII